MPTRKVRVTLMNLSPTEFVRVMQGENEEKIKEEKELREWVEKLKKEVEGWIESFNNFEDKEKGPPEELRSSVCAYFKRLKAEYIDKENKKILNEYKKYQKKPGGDNLKKKIRELESKKQQLQKAFDKACKKYLPEPVKRSSRAR